MDQVQSDEIDLFSIFETVWDGKWKIIFFIFISTMVCVSYLLYTPNYFKVTTTIQKSNQDLYYKYKNLNNILGVNLNDNLMLSSDPETKNFLVFPDYREDKVVEKFEINNLLIFEMFINEFNDYEEMITVLSENKDINDEIRSLNNEEKRKKLISYAKNFSITQSKNKSWEISFIWHNVDEGNLLFDKALKLTLLNIQKSLSFEINNIAKSIDLENQRKKASLNIEINSIRTLNKLMNAKRTRYLIEQSDIAKELGIEKNQLDKLTIESPNYPYYLRGYKAIDKELELIKNRSNQDNDLMSKGYIDLKRKLLRIEKDIRSKQLKDANEAIKQDNISNWVNFNLDLAEIENLKKSNLLLLISILAGGILGVFYVLISKSFKERKNI